MTLDEIQARNERLLRPVRLFTECSQCSHWHPVEFDGDCRDDINRLTTEELNARYGPDGWAEQMFDIKYICPECQTEWEDRWSCACDSECPDCGARDVGADEWEPCREEAYE